MLKKERYRLFVSHFSAKQPNAETELHYNNPFQLLVAVILSAQCTDKRVNITTPAIFEKYPDVHSLARAEKEALANQRLSASLTPLLVQHEMIDKLSEKIQIMVVPQGSNFLMQLPNIAAQK